MTTIKNFDPLQNHNWENFQKQLDSQQKLDNDQNTEALESLKMAVKPLGTVRARFESQTKLDDSEKMQVLVKSVFSKDFNPMDPNVLSACCCTCCCCSASS